MIKVTSNLNSYENFELNNYETVVCIGFFDGLHKMHQEIIKKTKEIALKEAKKAVVITFSQKISDFLNNKNHNIQSKSTKYKLIEEKFNPDLLIEIQVNQSTITISPKNFCDFLVNNLNTKKIVVGSDFTFGYKGKGKIETLKNFFGKENIIIFQRIEEISTTKLKKLLENGDINTVNELLGYNFTIEIKRKDLNVYLINNININLKNGVYKIKVNEKILEVTLTNNILFFNENLKLDQAKIEILQKII